VDSRRSSGIRVILRELLDRSKEMRDRLRGGWTLFDAAQHGRELVDPVAALELPLVPPRRAGVDQRPEEVTSLGGVAPG
jgi:hypothetical protein